MDFPGGEEDLDRQNGVQREGINVSVKSIGVQTVFEAEFMSKES